MAHFGHLERSGWRMTYFFVRTVNPRPDFHLDMTAEERAIMTRHVEYWTDRAREGVAIVFGPMLDPAGAFGTGVYRAEDEDAMRELVEADPAFALLRSTVTSMAGAVVGGEVRDRKAG